MVRTQYIKKTDAHIRAGRVGGNWAKVYNMFRMIRLTEASLDYQSLQNLLFQNHPVQVLKMLTLLYFVY